MQDTPNLPTPSFINRRDLVNQKKNYHQGYLIAYSNLLCCTCSNSRKYEPLEGILLFIFRQIRKKIHPYGSRRHHYTHGHRAVRVNIL